MSFSFPCGQRPFVVLLREDVRWLVLDECASESAGAGA